jgi:hypothetical protein
MPFRLLRSMIAATLNPNPQRIWQWVKASRGILIKESWTRIDVFCGVALMP